MTRTKFLKLSLKLRKYLALFPTPKFPLLLHFAVMWLGYAGYAIALDERMCDCAQIRQIPKGNVAMCLPACPLAVYLCLFLFLLGPTALRIIINRKERLYLFASHFDITSALRSVPPVRWLSGRVMLLCPRATEFHLVASEQPT